MHKNKYVVNMRFKPYIELAHHLRNHEYEGIFECHVTVDNHGDQQQFMELCTQIGCKAILIELPSGEVQNQLMTSSYHTGNLKDVLTQCYSISQTFAKAGFTITRTKVEALFSNKGVPETDEEAKSLSSENYFEFHIKVLLNATDDVDKLRDVVHPFGGHLSRSAFKKVDNSTIQRFVTLRLYGIGKSTASEKLNQCVEAIKESGFNAPSSIREYSIYDSNVQLDKGWINTLKTTQVQHPTTDNTTSRRHFLLSS